MAEILGKVTTASHEIPRGADVSLRIGVPKIWLAEGRTIEVELPRNLSCAKCAGGGCSACGNAGAITLRSRTELPELVQVVLPLSSLVETAMPCLCQGDNGRSNLESDSQSGKHSTGQRSIVIRIPECGGLPDASKAEILRGWLLLEVEMASEVSPNVRTLDEDAIDSSKMLRAAVRTSGKSATDPDFKTVVLPRRSRAPKAGDKEIEPPSSRVARVGSTTPPRVKSARPSKSERAAATSAESGVTPIPAEQVRNPSAAHGIYLGIALLTVAAMLWLFFL